MPSNIPASNPQNFFDTIYWFLTGQQLSTGAALESIFHFLGEVALIGGIISIIFLIAFIYLHLSLQRLRYAQGERLREQEEAITAHRALPAESPNRARWQHIMHLMGSASPNDWRSAIMDADVMLDVLLTERGFIGEDVGEKLQSASRGPFASLEAAWESHRIRNAIAHGGITYTLTDRDARIAIDGYGRVFEEFNYI